jgi:hypothetical protein
MRTYGIADITVNDPAKAKHTETTQRFRVQLVSSGGTRFPSKVEFSRRATSRGQSSKEADAKAMEQIDAEVARRYNRLTFRCQHYTGEAAVIQKVLALAGRPVTQARDVFDLDILRRGGYMQGIRLQEILGRRRCAAALENLESLSFEDYSGQVAEFLDDEHRREYGHRAAWDALVEQTREMLLL